MRLNSSLPTGFTSVSHIFIDEYMAAANGEFVKTYLLLLRLQEEGEITLAELADRLEQTEKDVLRALRYWAREGLLGMEEKDGEITRLQLHTPSSRRETQGTLFLSQPAPVEEAVSFVQEAVPAAMPETTAAPAPVQETAVKKEEALPSRSYSGAKLLALKEQPDFEQMLFVVERYLGRPLTDRDLDVFAYLYDELHFPGEVLEYLAEYCVEKWEREEKKKDYRLVRYMEKTALNWHAAGALTLPQAKKQTQLFADSHAMSHEVARELGLRGRGLSPEEEGYLSLWQNELNMPRELVLEACRRTIRSKKEVDFRYTDGIIKSWAKENIRSLEQVKAADERHQNEGGKKQEKKASAKAGTDYRSVLSRLDYAELLKK